MNYPFASRTQSFESSAVRDILKVTQQAHVISFAGGLPAEDIFPVEAVRTAYDKVFSSGNNALQYGLTEGFIPLREMIQVKMERKGIKSSPENILVTTGSQQVIDLFSRVMLNEGDVVLTEDPTYLSALQVFHSYGAEVIAVHSDQEGMDPEDLKVKLEQYQPKFVYVIPTFSNPDGKVWSAERRQQLLNLCYQYNILILEDDPYGDIQFHEHEHYQPLASLDEQRTHVVYTSTFSKSVVPALRTGWVTGPIEIIQMMAKAKQMNDLHSSSLDQQALYYLLRDFDLDSHIQTIRREYYHRMTIMRDYLAKLGTDLFKCAEPKGGMFMWVEANEEINTTALLHQAVEKGVAFVPGAPFYVGQPKYNTFRLNFSHSSPERIQEGMDRLVSVLLKPAHSK
ncbi:MULTISPECIES: aminotransferase-like domain-containing protein [Neobacillus]|uniref:PLP-dependent aminotransferase family protein n=1 Tax=Neobacillus rhizophilus TaxID=2833579 RepID=A0A942YV08_9BACI|nr:MULTISPECIES: PLP-dependent aminotransferase family protein [Neobacillus]MBS4211006.1 PLP-dependent aminotransferase family protein [Neobacillus rhizophilus]